MGGGIETNVIQVDMAQWKTGYACVDILLTGKL